MSLAQRVKEIIEDIPEEKFCEGTIYQNGRCCLMGHYIKETNNNLFEDYLNLMRSGDTIGLQDNITYTSVNHNELAVSIEKFLFSKIGKKVGFYIVNDNHNESPYKSPSIKERNMMLLEDMIESGY